MALIALDDETGVSNGRIAYYRTEKQQKAWLEKKAKGYSKHITGKGEYHFVQAYQQKFKEFVDSNNDIDFALIGATLIIGTYVSWNDNILPFKTIQEFAIRLNVSNVQAKRIRKKMVDNDFLMKTNNNTFEVNTDYLRKGMKKNKNIEFVKVFQKNVRHLVQHLRLQDIGLVGEVIPYVSFYGGIVCKNPREMDEKKIEHMSITELAETIGINRKTLNNKLVTMKISLENETNLVRVFEKLNVGKTVKILINTNILARSENEKSNDA